MSLAAPEKYWDEVKSIQKENIEEGTGAKDGIHGNAAGECF